MGGNSYSWRREMQPGIQGTGSTYYSSGWLGIRPPNPASGQALTGTVVSELPSVGHIQSVIGFPTGHLTATVQTGSFWFSIDTRDNVIIYQSPVTATGVSFVQPDIWYPAGSKFVCHATGQYTRFMWDGVVSDI